MSGIAMATMANLSGQFVGRPSLCNFLERIDGVVRDSFYRLDLASLDSLPISGVMSCIYDN